MKKLTLTATFAKYGARLINTRWACSAIAEDGAMVISGWNHFLSSSDDGHLCYEDKLSRWRGNYPGRNLLANHLQIAYDERLPVRLVVATLDDSKKALINMAAGDASILPNSFSRKRIWLARL